MSAASDSQPHPTRNADDDVLANALAWILGRGRSGTTWLGTMLNASPRCLYKYEPFSLDKSNAWVSWLDRIAEGREEDCVLRRRFFELCRSVDPQVDYPPFLRKRCRPQSPALLRLTWQLEKGQWGMLAPYRKYGRPAYARGDWVLLKQVNFPNELLDRVAALLQPRIIAVLRNPFASVDAARRFLKPGERLKTASSLGRVRELLPLARHRHLLRFDPLLETMSDVAFEALRWRVQSEPLAGFCSGYGPSTILTHEQLCQDADLGMQQVYRFLDWPLDARTRRIYEELTQPSRFRSLLARGRRGLHSVRQDSRAVANKWRANLDPQEIREIADVVGDSPLLRLWPDLESSGA